MRTLQKFLPLVLIFAIVKFAPASTLEETLKKQFPAEKVKQVTLSNVNGSVLVEGWDKQEIQITAYKKVRASGSEKARELLEKLEVEIIESDREIEITTHLPRRHNSGGFFAWLFDVTGTNASVKYEIKVPHKMDLELRSTNGGIQLFECSGSIIVHTTNGKISGDKISGNITAKTTNGSIEMEMLKLDPEEKMSLKTTNGSIWLYLPGDANVDIKAKTTNGRIRSELPFSERYEKSKRRLEGSINKGGPLIYLKTTNGSIKILEL